MSEKIKEAFYSAKTGKSNVVERDMTTAEIEQREQAELQHIEDEQRAKYDDEKSKEKKIEDDADFEKWKLQKQSEGEINGR